MKNNKNHKKLYKSAQKVIPGGVNSAFRAVTQVGLDTPLYMRAGKGAYIIDIDKNRYLDMSMAWGPLVAGHVNSEVQTAIESAMRDAWITGTCTELEISYSQKLIEIFPSMEKVRLQTSGTESVGVAIRLSRAFTGKNHLVTIKGGYHGHRDTTLLSVSGEDKVVSSSSGIPKVVHDLVHPVHYNDLDALRSMLEKNKEIAAVLMEPVPANMGLTLPKKGYLQGVRDLCSRYGVVLIFDEVISGVWASMGGAQEKYGVRPDLTILGKAIGGGLPVGAIGGKKEIMDLLKPIGDVYAAGTYAGHPLSMTAGLATLEYLQNNPDLLIQAQKNASYYKDKVNKFAEEHGFACRVVTCGALVSIFFGVTEDQESVRDTWGLDSETFKDFYSFMLRSNIYMSPSSEDVMFVSTAHTRDDMDILATATINFIKTKLG